MCFYFDNLNTNNFYMESKKISTPLINNRYNRSLNSHNSQSIHQKE